MKNETLIEFIKETYYEQNMSAEEFTTTLSNIYLSHENFLRLSSISFTNIENNCSEEKINAFAKNIQPYYNVFLIWLN